jgi:hypothetical protein
MMIVIGNAFFGRAADASSCWWKPSRCSGPDRHHALLHEHRRARDLRDGQGRGSAGTLRHAALRKPDPHRAIWTLAAISAVIGCIAVVDAVRRRGRASDATIKALPQGFWSQLRLSQHDTMAAMPNSLLTVTLASNFGTFLLYALSCIICMVGFHNHPKFNPVKHLIIPVFGLVANLACMAFYLIGPFMGYGTKMEPLLALGIAAVWASTAASTSCLQQEERQDDAGGNSGGRRASAPDCKPENGIRSVEACGATRRLPRPLLFSAPAYFAFQPEEMRHHVCRRRQSEQPSPNLPCWISSSSNCPTWAAYATTTRTTPATPTARLRDEGRTQGWLFAWPTAWAARNAARWPRKPPSKR